MERQGRAMEERGRDRKRGEGAGTGQEGREEGHLCSLNYLPVSPPGAASSLHEDHISSSVVEHMLRMCRVLGSTRGRKQTKKKSTPQLL